MRTPRTLLIATVALVLASCGGSGDGGRTDDTLVEVTTTALDLSYLADGAFTRNPTQHGDGSTDSGATTVASTLPDGTAVAPTTVADATVAPDSAAPGLQPGQGFVRVGDVEYTFPTSTCEVDVGNFFAAGSGSAPSGELVQISIVVEMYDVDGDGVVDTNLDISVEPDASAGDPGKFPLFSASKLQSAGLAQGQDIAVVLTDTGVSGSGPIEDLNAVVIPAGQTLPMTFGAECP